MNGPTVPPAIEMPLATPIFSEKYSLKIPTLCTYVNPMPKPIRESRLLLLRIGRLSDGRYNDRRPHTYLELDLYK